MSVLREKVLSAGSASFGFVNVPDRLFKRFEREKYARELAEQGKVRIGTLYEFRKTDGWDELRGDAGEGSFRTSLTSDDPETLTGAAPWPLGDLVNRIGTSILSHGGTINIKVTSPDAYIYCTLEQVVQDNTGYGAFVVEIFDVEGFFTALTRHLTDERGVAATEPHGFLAPCLYENRWVQATSADQLRHLPPHIAFVKPITKRTEREVRAIWHPSEEHAEPIETVCPDISRYCRYSGLIAE